MSFTIGNGETVALVGESGSGKTVSAMSILRLLPNSASHPTGEILFEGKDILKANEAQLRAIRGRRISIIFQEPMTTLNPLHTIEKQVGEIIKLHQKVSDQATRTRVIELLTKVGIRDAEKRLGAYPHQLSGGQRQRVMIAIALANEPDLLIADEPTTALDVTIQAQILELLKSLQKEMGMAMLLITHDLGIVRHMADRVYVMQNGEIVETGNAEEVFTVTQASLYAPSPRSRTQGQPAVDQSVGPRRCRDGRSQGLVSDQARFSAKNRRLREGRRRIVDEAASRRNAWRRRRVRFRQNDTRPRNPAAAIIEGPDRLRRQAHRRA